MNQANYDPTLQKKPTKSPFLTLPSELRHQVYLYLFGNASKLRLRSLFIRSHYLNVFMTQQPKGLSPGIIRVCKQIASETLPILYSAPRWVCGCRVEALAVQIGRANFASIRLMQVDVDDLDLLVENLQRARQRKVHRGSGFAMQEFPFRVPDSLRQLGGDRTFDTEPVPWNSVKSLDFGNLEVLEVEGFQAAALTSQGTRRVREEALRLCELAAQLMDFHPKLKILLQSEPKSDGGADARDLTLGRVHWTFIKCSNLPEVGGSDKHIMEGERSRNMEQYADEQVVDLSTIRAILEQTLQEDDAVIESSLPVAWTSDATGRFNQYPYLRSF